MATSTSNEEIPMYKNRLQEYTQKLALPLPIYINEKEGFQHTPIFKSKVKVNGKFYEAHCTFPTRKEAEQEAARTALECLTKQNNGIGFPLKNKEPRFCKSNLYEYAVKNKLKKPSFRTVTQAGPRPVFRSYMNFGGKSYTGEVAASKKMAENLVARAAIGSILETNGESMSRIIQSRDKHFLRSPTNEENNNALTETFKDEPIEPGVDVSANQMDKRPENLPANQANIQVSKNLPYIQTSSQTATVRFNSYGEMGGQREKPKGKPEISPWQQNKKVVADSGNAHKPQMNNWVQNKTIAADPRSRLMRGPGPQINNWQQNKKTIADPRNEPKSQLAIKSWNLRKRKNQGS